MIDKEKLKIRFSRNAKQYDKYATVQKRMGDRLIDYVLSQNIYFNDILEVGCGTGYITRAMVHKFPNAKITGIDIAPGMIEHIKSTVQNQNVDFICADAECIDLNSMYDLIISNAAFQWFNDLERTFENLVKLVNKGGVLCFSIFGQHTFSELRQAFLKAGELLEIDEPITPGQSFFSVAKLKDVIGKNIHGNSEFFLEEIYDTEYFDCCMDFLYSVKKIGANNSQSDRNASRHDFIEKVMDIYDSDHSVNNKVKATYHNIFAYINIK
ncbi:malonyl-CoA O-methyltransferase [Anaerobacterium chartisolvens]|uniref:Malonyl-[acyl-carrier protein] O-methyltransferase n=1 Tax=Anaerobacterium chartisolvens TaxID=1297424 RepID=A0A369BD44_9FIRM|nr:malonyl-ACP O-methyltransferase BioC [Anaerobacterium chartisolvens]RCX18377.1 malonyl-CoA O-methyltransferase [Anaerobacterium chartisolvens]